MNIPRYTGLADDPNLSEAEHLANCEYCGALIDLRDLAQLVAHTDGQGIKELDGPEQLN